jgi:succinyl-diaminopimelate desuccinylase
MLRLAESLDPSLGFAHRVYVFYAGEEGPAVGNGLAALLVAHPWLRGAGLALLLEPTCGDLELGCSGSMHLAVTFHGKACHSARPWTGEHPLRHALPWLEAILARPIREAEIAGVTFRELAVPTRLRAGEVRNVVPGSLEVNLNVRYPPDRTPTQAEELARSLFPDGTVFRRFGRRPSVDGPHFFEDAPEDGGLGPGAGEGAGRFGVGGSPAVRMESPGIDVRTPAVGDPPPGSITVELSDHSPAGRIALDAPLYRHLLESTGLPRRGKQGWTDVARFSALGVPALNWGPGDPAFAHTKDEFVEVAEAERFVARLRAYLLGAGPKV